VEGGERWGSGGGKKCAREEIQKGRRRLKRRKTNDFNMEKTNAVII
jgi:hypothetical protein